MPQNALRGQLEFRTEKRGIIHVPVGKVSAGVERGGNTRKPPAVPREEADVAAHLRTPEWQASWDADKLRANIRVLMVRGDWCFLRKRLPAAVCR